MHEAAGLAGAAGQASEVRIRAKSLFPEGRMRRRTWVMTAFGGGVPTAMSGAPGRDAWNLWRT